jgi:large subunit ribosomal protein L22
LVFKEFSMEAIAKLKNVPMSERKMRLVVDNIRGKNISEALSILRFTKRESGIWLKKLLDSAIANWGNKAEGSDVADFDLFVKTAFVDGGTMIKRFRPAPHGRAHRIRKRTNHVTIIVENKIPLEKETVAVATASEE